MGKLIHYKLAKETRSVMESGSGRRAIVEHANALDCYEQWPPPTTIISDGPYGLSKYPGDPTSADSIAEIYAPHIAEWSKYALPETTLWFWCSEVGWAEVHGLLKMHGWKYRAAHIWDKGIGHVAGNSNGDSIRGFPVVTEICVQYVREITLRDEEGIDLPLKEWLRKEWLRSGLPLTKTNEACGVRNAATRKYFTQCHLWYFPPAPKMMALAEYATKYGKETSRPYFSLDGKAMLTDLAWERLRAKWNHEYGITNVWSLPAVRGDERIKIKGLKAIHANQKPLKLMRRLIQTSSNPGDVVWEPFGGLCSATVAALELERRGFAAEIIKSYYDVAYLRLREKEADLLSETHGYSKDTAQAVGA